MIQKRRRHLALAFLSVDLSATIAAFGLAYYTRFHLALIPVTKGIPDPWRYAAVVPILILIWPLVLYYQRLYEFRPAQSRVEEVSSVSFAAVLGTVLTMGLLSFYREFTYSRAMLAVFVGLDIVLVAGGRIALRTYFERLWVHGRHRRRVMLVGSGELARQVADRVDAHRELGLELVGFVDDAGLPSAMAATHRRLGSLDDVPALLAGQEVDELYVALPLSRHDDMLAVLRAGGKEGVDIKFVPDLVEYIALRAGFEDLDGLPIVDLTRRPLEGWNSLVKRSFDIAAAAALLVLLSPLFGLIALAIWIEDRGSIFFRQIRMGLDGKSFEILKFRSMGVDAEAETGAVWAQPGDSRRTRIGTFLRETSLDELPQLVNVLEGDMSLVGPRPERPEFVAQFKEKVPQYMLRHKVRSGITGWAQVNGWRGNTSIEKRIEYDLYYIENWSFRLDLKILWMTLKTGFRNENAY